MVVFCCDLDVRGFRGDVFRGLRLRGRRYDPGRAQRRLRPRFRNLCRLPRHFPCHRFDILILLLVSIFNAKHAHFIVVDMNFMPLVSRSVGPVILSSWIHF